VQFIAKNCRCSTTIKIHVPSVSAHLNVVEITLKLSNTLLNFNSHESGNTKTKTPPIATIHFIPLSSIKSEWRDKSVK
jgi:hypothetical protein